MQQTLTVAGFLSLVSFGGLWLADTLAHRSHMSQAAQDLQRLWRLERRLIGVVTELEDRLVGGVERSHGELHESLVGHVNYLFGIRRESADSASALSRHFLQLRWPTGYLSRATLAARRCQRAQQDLSEACEAMSVAARVYEAAIRSRYASGKGAPRSSRLTPDKPLFLLKASDARQLVGVRDRFDAAVRSMSQMTHPGSRALEIYECRWPVWRSELPDPDLDPYSGEVRPIMWTGMGGVRLIDVDAR